MRIARTITTTLAAVALAGGASLVAVASTEVHTPSPTTVSLQQYSAQAEPAEDDPRFDCRKHGNRVCAFYLDPKPSDANHAQVKYLIHWPTGVVKDARHWLAPMTADGKFTRR